MRLLKGWIGRGTAAFERLPEQRYPSEGRIPANTGTSQAMVLQSGRNAVGMVERSAMRGERRIHSRSIVAAG
jgi:hypothetical protein